MCRFFQLVSWFSSFGSFSVSQSFSVVFDRFQSVLVVFGCFWSISIVLVGRSFGQIKFLLVVIGWSMVFSCFWLFFGRSAVFSHFW